MKKVTLILILLIVVINIAACKLTMENTESSGQGAMFPVITDESTQLSSEETADNKETKIADLLPFPDSKTGLWGYINQKGEFVIEPKFKLALEFDENNQAQVLTDNDLIHIDREGNPVVYRNVLEFAENGLAAYLDESGLWGYVNKDGELVIEIQFESAGTFAKNGLASVVSGFGRGWINEKGEYVIETEYSWGTDFANNGLAAAQKGDDLCGYINEKEEYIIEPQFKNAFGFQENGLACVQDIKGLYGFINENGEYVIEPQFIAEHGFTPYFEENGLACVFNGSGWGFINEKGEYVIEPQYYWYSKFAKNGLANVLDENGLYGFINEQGEYIIESQYKQAAGFNESGISLVQDQNGLWGYINEEGVYIIGPK